MQARVHFTGGSTVTPVDKSCYLTQLAWLCSDAGTNWKAAIRSRGSTPMIVGLGTTQTASPNGLATPQKYDFPLFMENGIDVAHISGTAGVVDIWIDFKPQP